MALSVVIQLAYYEYERKIHMAKNLILTEKPSVAKDIARVLGLRKAGDGFFEGDRYVLTWALGHLVTLADPESYDPKYASWRMEDLPMLPEKLKLVVIKQTGKQFRTVSSQLNRKDVDGVIIATDAGREGELVARWILEKSNSKKPIKRLWISSVTDKAIKDGFSSLKPGRDYENLYSSAFARSAADWYVGINATRALTCKYNAQLSCGRVQTPTLSMISNREKEIQSFKPSQFFGLVADTDKLTLSWIDGESNSARTFSESKVLHVIDQVKGKEAIVEDVKKTLKKSYAPGLYNLTELQRDANRMFGFSAKDTLNIMQNLYEHHKILTYPRTDSRFISEDILSTIPDRLKSCGVGSMSSIAFRISKGPIKANKSFVDNSKVTDHHAIIPTEEFVRLPNLSPDERKIYDLVVKRFLSVMMPPFEYEETSITVKLGASLFKAKGRVIMSQGWKEAYSNSYEEESDEEDLGDQIIPQVKRGDRLKVTSLKKTAGYTGPPSYFTEGTLLSAMESPGKFMGSSDKELLRILSEAGGIGTVATRADIIEKLLSTFLIEKKGKEVHITSKGRQLLSLVPDDLKSPALTAHWEKKLDLISKGNLKKDDFLSEIKVYTNSLVANIRNSSEKFVPDNVTREKCPDCGKFMLEVNGKRGKMLVCPDRECGHRKMVARVTNARCPECHKKMVMKGSGDSEMFVCSCGYREKLSSFLKRKEESSSRGSKKDVQNFLEEMKKENEKDHGTSPFAALLKLKS
jgi:DNA topoisomerase III